MPLTLKIVSKQRHILGADSTRVFSVHGGSIGRAPDNDWVLPDPDRYISGHHATIDYRGGAYYLRDNSTNGVYVNQSEQPVGRGAPLRLYDGDELRMGDYIFEVGIVNVSRDGADDSGDAATPGQAPVLARAASATEPGKPGLTLKLLGDEADALEGAALAAAANPLDAAAQDDQFAATMRMTDNMLDTQTDVATAARQKADHQRVEALRQAESVHFKHESAPPPESKAVFAAGSARDFREAVRLLMECAGLDATQLPKDQEDELMAIAGRFIRTTAEGLQSVLRSRAVIKAHFRVAQTAIQAEGNNPLKFMPTTQDALEQMFYERTDGYLAPVEALEDAFRHLRAHENAMVKAMQVAVRDLLDRLDPEALEEKFQRTVKKGGLLSPSAKSKYWDMYREAYRSIAGFSDEQFASVLGGKFADAYDREMHQATTRPISTGAPAAPPSPPATPATDDT